VRPTGYLGVFDAGAACIALAALLAARHAWKNRPGAPAIAFFLAIGFVMITLGVGYGGRPAAQVLLVSGIAVEAFAAALGLRSLRRRGRAEPEGG
jgi:hypothetical protein